MKRLYFVAPDIASAKQVVDELLLARIDERHIHVLAKDGTPLDNLPSASFFHKTDLAHAIEQGLALGGATGLLAGVVAVTVPPAGLILGGGAVLLATTVAGAGIGAWSASLRALNIPNTQHRQFEEEIEAGKLLMIVDVPKDKVEEVRSRIGETHHEVRDGGVDRTIPHFP